MSDSYDFYQGRLPLLISVPHDGRRVPPDIESRMSDAGKLLPDTDWHVTKLYEFAKELGASIITANYSRYVVDLNRASDDVALYEGQLQTGLCPLKTFSGEDIYTGATQIDRADRVLRYWRPYHEKIAQTLSTFCDEAGYALLWDAHSIKSHVPSLFDDQLPVLNIGTWDGRSCGADITDAVSAIARSSDYPVAINERFKGGFITRHYGDPDHNVHAIQLELAQRAYMDEETGQYDAALASTARECIAAMLTAFMQTAGAGAAILSK